MKIAELELNASRFFVAQVSNLLYRGASSLRMPRSMRRNDYCQRPADWKSAIRQVGNLRYNEAVRLYQ